MTTQADRCRARIPLRHRGKRPRFFETTGSDEFISMVLELTAELWVLRKRMYLLERVAGRAGLALTQGIENYELSAEELAELDARRRELLTTVLRSLESEQAERQRVRQEMETLGSGMTSAERVA